MLYPKYNTPLVQPIFKENIFLLNRRYVIIKTLLTPQSQAKPLFMTFKININNVFIHLYKNILRGVIS